jgi:hypothetical protein
MTLRIFDCIIYDAKLDMDSCLKNPFLRSQLTDFEISIIVPLTRLLLSSATFDDYMAISYLTVDDLKKRLAITDDVIEEWCTKGFSLFDRYALTFFIVSNYLETIHYHAKLLGTEE